MKEIWVMPNDMGKSDFMINFRMYKNWKKYLLFSVIHNDVYLYEIICPSKVRPTFFEKFCYTKEIGQFLNNSYDK